MSASTVIVAINAKLLERAREGPAGIRASMTVCPPRRLAPRARALSRLKCASATWHGEAAHMALYTLAEEEPRWRIVAYGLHCTAGDVL